MKLKLIIFLFSLFISLSAYNQNGVSKKIFAPEHQLNGNRARNNFLKRIEKSQINLNDSIERKNCLNFFSSLLYSEIKDYTTEINQIYSNYREASVSDTMFYLECLKMKAISSNQEHKYHQAVSEYREYFNIMKSYYQSDTLYSMEYINYSNAILHTKSTKHYMSVLDSALIITDKKKNPNNDFAEIYRLVGSYYLDNMSLDTARKFLNKAQEYLETAHKKNRIIEKNLLISQGYLELKSSNPALSLQYYSSAIDLLLEIPHTDEEMALLYTGKADALYFLDQQTDAINLNKMALYVLEKKPKINQTSIIRTYRILGLLYSEIMEYSTAIEYFNKALKIEPSPKNFKTYRNLAKAYLSSNNLANADSVFKLCIQYTTKTKGPNSYQSSCSYYDYSIYLLEKTNKLSLGEKYLKKCIQIRYNTYQKKTIDLVEPLNIIGTHYINTGRINQGLDSLQSALIMAIPDFYSRNIFENPPLNKFIKHTNFHNTLAWKAYGFYLKYLETSQLKYLKTSFKTYDQFIYLAKEIRKQYKNTESYINAERLNYVYGQAVDISQQLYQITNNPYYLEKTFQFIEGRKSFTLLNSLKILESKKLLKIPETLLQKETDFKTKLGELKEKISIEQKHTHSVKNIQDYETQIFNITISLDSIQSSYKNNYSGFFNLKYGFKELSINDIITKMPANHAFLNYALSDSLLTILCITKKGAHLFNKTIDSTFFNKVNKLVQLLKKFNTDDSYTEFRDFSIISHELYTYLIKPTEKEIKDKELIIIPDGILNYISFDALLTDTVNIERPDYRMLPYLIKKYKTNVANSLQVYFNMKTRERKAQDQVFAFAPYYQKKQDTTGLPSAYHYLRPLDYAQIETHAINKYLPTIEYTGKAASEETFTKNAKEAKILHLAMHTIINDEEPMYSKLLFTYDSATKSGLVNTYELLTMNLNAELAVLSGCSTGNGELKKGEGVMSLSSGFQYAGVPAIIMSLWEVNDKFGSLVIENFYKNIAKGLPKNQALHQAKLQVLSQGNALYAHPFYWSGLTLMGDDSKIIFDNYIPFKYITLSLLMVSLIVFITVKFKKKQS